MKLAIVGSRNITVPDIQNYIPGKIVTEPITEIVSGGARGIDACAKRYAGENRIDYTEFLPDYKRFGRGAPIVRNKQIIEYSDFVLVLWDNKSRGTKWVIDYCFKIDKPFFVHDMHLIGGEYTSYFKFCEYIK